jgi:hypothetical protein
MKPALVVFSVAPVVVSFFVNGWLGYEPCVKGHRIVDTQSTRSEAWLKDELARRSIRHAVADYWAAYRLTFLFGESTLVVPIHEKQDRYSPYRKAVKRATRFAYIYDRKRSLESLQTVMSRVDRGLAEHFEVGDFDVYILESPPAAGIADWS